ncbi:transcriptional regulator, partial [Streptomyces tateyamensis]
MSEELDPTSSLAALYGYRAKKARERLGLTQTQVGTRTHTHSTRINQIERNTGSRPTLELSKLMDQALDTDELLQDLWPHVESERYPDYAQAFMRYEAQAVGIQEFTGHVVPGLLQTRSYARAVLRLAQLPEAKQDVERNLAARMSRQSLILRPDGTRWEVILDEGVILRVKFPPDL